MAKSYGAVNANIQRSIGNIRAVLSDAAVRTDRYKELCNHIDASIHTTELKIDQNPGNSGYRTWEQTQVNNSGAEKFVVYFAVILAMMAYARDGYDDMTGERRSVLILDNPFGPISSRHVLEPMFAIAKNYHVQMICLSDISKSDIVSCFELVIRAIVKRFTLSSKEQLTHEGNERIEHGFYRAEQCSMFP